jgi:hypothetical protein
VSQTPRAVDAGETLDSLVDQFADPYAFLRELIQNSIDAGSSQIFVSFDFKPSNDKDKGILVLHIDDTGEGMNREIIDTQLTRLFSSSKESDYTKIGKFGIGFVSIFALKPRAVILDTGRGGEFWRIWFEQDRTFKRIVLDRPVEGTQIQFIKELTVSEFISFKERSLKTIIYWCKHAEAEILVDGEIINQPFELVHPLAVNHEGPGTSVSLAPTTEPDPFFGFYNRGLTLHEGKEAIIPGITFKIRSRYVEHTLTRDNVIKDENYNKAIAILQEAVDNTLRPALFGLAAGTKPVPASSSMDEIHGYLAHRLAKLPANLANTPVIPALDGRLVSLSELQSEAKKAGEVYYDRQPNHVSAKFGGTNLVLRWEGMDQQPGLGLLLKTILGKTPLILLNEAYVQPTVLTNLPEKDQSLLQAAFQILVQAGSPHKRLVPADFNYVGSRHQDRLYITQNEAGELQRAHKETGLKGLFGYLFGKKPSTLVVNVGHPLIEPHFRLRASEPALSAYLLAKALTLDDGLDAETNQKMLSYVLDHEAELVSKLGGG